MSEVNHAVLGLPRVSIITATYNSGKTLEECLISVARQTYANKEHLIIDGQSKDDTLAIIKKYQEQYPDIRYISEADKGVWDAMNKGIDMASGEWLYFLGSDDALKNERVLSNIFAAPGNEDYDVIYGNIEHRNAGTRFDDEFNNKLLARFNIAHQAIFYRKTVFEKTGKFDLRYVAFSDYANNIKWFGNKTIRRKYASNIICVYNETGLSSIYFDKTFFREKPAMLLKYLKFEQPADFTDAVRHVIYTQLKNGDITGALRNLVFLFRHAGPTFNKWLFIKEFMAILLKKNDHLAGQKFKEKRWKKP